MAQKKDLVRDTFEGLSPTMRLAVIAAVLILVFVIVKKVNDNIQERKAAAFNQLPPVGQNTTRDVRPIIDKIYEKLDGVNYLYVYPEWVNKIANFSEAELKAANDYWDSEYAGTTGETLYGFINAEWDGGEYEPALSKLERHGYN